MKKIKVKMTWHEWKMLSIKQRTAIQAAKTDTQYTLFSIAFKIPANQASALGLNG